MVFRKLISLVHTEGIELHERMRADKLRALKTAFDALQVCGGMSERNEKMGEGVVCSL